MLPLFALANAGVLLSTDILATAWRSPITWGIIAGLVVGKFVAVVGTTALLRALRIGELGSGLTTGRIAGGGMLCGIGFTISLFIVDLAITEPEAQNQARVGVLAASVIAFAVAAVVFRISDILHPTTETGRTLDRPVDPSRDHLVGRPEAPLTLVEYGDFQCGFCLKATGSVEEVHRVLGDRLRYVWRHAPLTEYHPNALAAAEAAEAAGRQGRFFEFSRSLFADQEHQLPADIARRAVELGLDLERFEADLDSGETASRVRDDLLDAEAMGIIAVPTFFINGRRHTGPYDAQTLIRTLEETAPVPR